uniref:EGF-like domain-containing protein n=1 Tax=Strongyloides venezuelensis TaxID=75913 RepID=A0A0K0EZE8_STRVS
MLVKFISILLFILQDTKLVSNVNGLRVQFSAIITCNYYKVNNIDYVDNGKKFTIDLNKLEKYKTEKTRYINVEFKEVKIFHLQLDDRKDSSTSPCGITFAIRNDEKYHSSFSIAYNEGNNFGSADYIYLFCNIQLCELGLIFFDKYKKTDALNDVFKVHTVEHAVLLVLKSSDNKILLDRRPYDEVNIRLGFCPYINWIHKKGWLKYIPEDHIIDNGFFEEENGYGHIVVPNYRRNDNVEEFICGTLKQPSLPNILIGIKLYNMNGYSGETGELNPLNNEIKCRSSDNPQYHYHFGYLERETNYMSERFMEAINVRDKDSKHKFYAGQKIYIYKWDKIKEGIKNQDSILRLKNPYVIEEASCIKNLKSDIKANILPTIGSVDSIQKHRKKNIFYRLIKLDDLYKNYTFRCLSKVEGINKAHMDEYYSRSAVFSIKNEDKPNIIYTLSENEIKFDRESMDNYGSYRCKESKVTEVFNKNVIKMDKVYYLPDENSELPLDNSKNNIRQYIGCIKQYESLGEIKKIRIEFGENVRKTINIVNFSKATDGVNIKENLITYKMPKNVPGVIVKCIYQTPADTTFYTKREISFVIRGSNKKKNITIFATNNDKAVTHYADNSTVWIAAIVITVLLSCIMVIIVAYIIVRKTKKRKVGNCSSSSISYSESSSLSKGYDKKSTCVGGIKKTATGKLKNDFNLIVVKMNKNGNDSKTSTTSSNVTGKSSSTNLTQNHIKNVKLTAK